MVKVNRRSTMTGHRDCVYTLAKSPRSGSFFSAAGDGMVVHWDLEDPEKGQLIARVPNSIYSIAFHPVSGLLCVGHNYEGVHFIDWENKKEAGSLKCTTGSIFSLYSSGEMLYMGDSGGYLYAIHVGERRIINKVRYSSTSVRSIDINPVLGKMAVGFSDNLIRILNVEDLSLEKEISAHSNSVFSVRFTSDGKYLLSAGRDAHIRLFDTAADYLAIQEVVGHMFAINNIEFSPDDKHFVTCSMDKSIKVWESDTLKLLKVIDKARHAGHGTSVNKLLWIDPKTVISASDDRTISAWDIELYE